jgi:hypothetical protein
MIGVSDERPGFGHSFRGGLLAPRRFAFATGHKGRHQLERVRPKGPGDNDEFHDIKPALAAFVFGDKGLRFVQPTGEDVLGQPCGLARPDHKLAKGGLVGRMDGFADTAGARCHQPGKLIPSSDYLKKG